MPRAILSIGLILLVFPAAASTIFYEGFTTPGELNGTSGGTGWGTPWTAVTANTEVVTPGAPLSYSVPGGGTITGGSSALQITGNNDVQISRNLDTAQTGDIFFSFLFRQNAGAIDTFDVTKFWFDNDNVTSNNQTLLPSIGAKGNQGTGSSPEDFIARSSSGGPAYSTSALAGTDYFIVGRLFKSGVGNYDSFSLWVNPSFGDSATPDVTATSLGPINSVLRLGLRSLNQDSDDVIYIDELKAGTTWDDVIPAKVIVPIPEPTTLVLTGLGLIGFVLSRRKRSRG